MERLSTIKEKFKVIAQVCNEDNIDHSVKLANSLEMVPLDLGFPELKLKMFEKQKIIGCTDAKQCIRLLLVTFIGATNLVGECYSSLLKKTPNQMSLIGTFINSKFKIEKRDFSKTIRNYCASLCEKLKWRLIFFCFFFICL